MLVTKKEFYTMGKRKKRKERKKSVYSKGSPSANNSS